MYVVMLCIASSRGQIIWSYNHSPWQMETKLVLLHTCILEIIPLYGMSSYITREDQYSKPPHKKLKDRQIDRQNRLNSPPSTIYKNSCATVYNGYGKGHSGGSSGGGGGGSGGGPGIKKTERRARSSPKSSDSDLQGNAIDTGMWRTPSLTRELILGWVVLFWEQVGWPCCFLSKERLL